MSYLFDSQFHKVLIKRIADEHPDGLLAHAIQDLSTGQPKDYPEYRQRVGFIDGIRAVLNEAEIIRKEFAEGKIR